MSLNQFGNRKYTFLVIFSIKRTNCRDFPEKSTFCISLDIRQLIKKNVEVFNDK